LQSKWRKRVYALLGCAVLCVVGVVPASASAGIDNVSVGQDFYYGSISVPYTVQATISNPGGRKSVVTITNPESNANLGGSAVITAATLAGPGGTFQDDPGFDHTQVGFFVTPFTSTVGDCNTLRLNPDYMSCMFSDYSAFDASGGIAPGQSATITYGSPPAGVAHNLWSLDVDFDFDDLGPDCRPSGFSDTLRWMARSSASFSYASDCAPPLSVSITSERIHQQSRTASFKQTAKHATEYFCELFHGRHSMFAHKCGSKKAYTNRLPKGTYTYEVWGLNKHGRSPGAAMRRFTLG
jgi:hypothetical protein